MSEYKKHDKAYRSKKALDPNWDDLYWLGIEQNERLGLARDTKIDDLDARLIAVEALMKTYAGTQQQTKLDTPAPETAPSRDAPIGTPLKALPSPGEWVKKLTGTLLDDPVQKSVDTRSGPTTITNASLDCEYGEVKLGFWGDKGDKLIQFVAGDRVQLKNLQVKDEYQGITQLNSGRYTDIKLVVE